MKWVGHILRKEDSFLARKMRMRMQNSYEEGSILLDAPQYDTMDELVELARDKEEWQALQLGTANAIYQQNDCLQQCCAPRQLAVLGGSEPRARKTQPAPRAGKCACPPAEARVV